jgi:hypothetical protein
MSNNINPPSGSASDVKQPECFGTDPKVRGVNVLTSDGRSCGLPFAQYLDSELVANPALETDPDAPTEKLTIHFVSATVTVLGTGIKRIQDGLLGSDLGFIKPLDRRFAGKIRGHVAEVRIDYHREYE